MRILIALTLLATGAPAVAEPLPESLDTLYARIADDLRAGKPLIIAAYYGMWFTRPEDPDQNLNWGGRWGHARMLERAKRDPHIKKNYRHWRWTRVFDQTRPEDPTRTMVFQQTVRPNRRWQAAGVQQPFEVYLVMQAFGSQAEAARRMTRNLRQSNGRALALEGGPTIDAGAAQVTAYYGHNLFYDHPGFHWDGLSKISGQPELPKGLAVVGCNTARVPGFPELLGPKTLAVLMSKSLMASEGYSTLSLAEGLIRRMDSKAFVKHADATYRYFQQLGKPGRRVGKPFVSQGYKLRR